MRSDLVDLDVRVHARTEKAVLVSVTGDSDDAAWIPLSQCEIEPHENAQSVYVLTCREPVALDKGLI